MARLQQKKFKALGQMTRYSIIIQNNIEIQSILGPRLKNFQQNGLLENKLKNPKKPESLGLEELSTKRLVN